MGLARISWNSVRVCSKLRTGLFRVLYQGSRFSPSGCIAYSHSIVGTCGLAIILKRENLASQTHQGPASEGFDPIVGAMAGDRRGACVGAGRLDAGGRAVDRPAFNHGAHAAPGAGMDTQQALSRTLRVHSA